MQRGEIRLVDLVERLEEASGCTSRSEARSLGSAALSAHLATVRAAERGCCYLTPRRLL